MTIMFDAIALAAGVATTPDHRPTHPAAHRVPAKSRRGGPLRRLFRDVLSDIGGAVPPHAFEGLRRWQRRRNTVTELTALDDHMLRDIGIPRGSIRERVNLQLRLQAGIGAS